MDVILICSLAVCAVIISKLFEKGNSDMKFLLTISVVVMLSIRAVAEMSGVFDAVSELVDKTEFSGEYIKIMFKALGICLVCRISTDCCKDAGESAIASQIELLCRVSLILISLPLYSSVIEIIVTLIGN